MVIQQNIDTTTKEGRLMFSILGSLAQFENELRKERCEEGQASSTLSWSSVWGTQEVRS